MTGRPDNLEADLSVWLDGELPPERAREVEALLAASPEARRLLADLRAVSARIAALPRMSAPPELAHNLEQLTAQRASTTAHRVRRGPRILRLSLPFAAAAAIVLTVLVLTDRSATSPSTPSLKGVVTAPQAGPSGEAAVAPRADRSLAIRSEATGDEAPHVVHVEGHPAAAAPVRPEVAATEADKSARPADELAFADETGLAGPTAEVRTQYSEALLSDIAQVAQAAPQAETPTVDVYIASRNVHEYQYWQGILASAERAKAAVAPAMRGRGGASEPMAGGRGHPEVPPPPVEETELGNAVLLPLQQTERVAPLALPGRLDTLRSLARDLNGDADLRFEVQMRAASVRELSRTWATVHPELEAGLRRAAGTTGQPARPSAATGQARGGGRGAPAAQPAPPVGASDARSAPASPAVRESNQDNRRKSEVGGRFQLGRGARGSDYGQLRERHRQVTEEPELTIVIVPAPAGPATRPAATPEALGAPAGQSAAAAATEPSQAPGAAPATPPPVPVTRRAAAPDAANEPYAQPALATSQAGSPMIELRIVVLPPSPPPPAAASQPQR
ncbi:MAG: hypothetical protein AB1716_03885 [Planctomycetota bacterium]